MARNGWLHFSVMATDCEFHNAISLCGKWDEFFELNCLALWQYFPASKWIGWSGNFLIKELTHLRFVPFFMDLKAQQETAYNSLGPPRERSFGSRERYKESMKLIIELQTYRSPGPRGHHEWTWFCMEILDWLNLKIYYDDYVRDPINPWPHRYILEDIVQAFITMSLFFPNVEVTSTVQDYLQSEEGQTFRNSKIFDPEACRPVRPDSRTRTSCTYRPKKFWDEWENNVYTGDDFYIDAFPFDWNMAIRPTIAKPGMVGSACIEFHPDVVPGFATVNTEEHWPGKLDLFITYSNTDRFVKSIPPSIIDYRDWLELLPAARKYAVNCKTKTPRFALFHLWSAPHFYTLMMLPMRQAVSFLDHSVHNTTRLQLGYLQEQMMGLGPGFKIPVDKPRGRIWAETKHSVKD
ncbi:hypothetical protein QBC36DRAFT_299732 [Triangularia setosa]|uniref:Uncharacterized protein n=1 Tax=Triangularia setosa TaxID=2587417 RepID=A0AAN7A9G2_9PEZI|nr:hypothetical protein QBC36DRAFT_299732 [Podospora setosa]